MSIGSEIEAWFHAKGYISPSRYHCRESFVEFGLSLSVIITISRAVIDHGDDGANQTMADVRSRTSKVRRESFLLTPFPLFVVGVFEDGCRKCEWARPNVARLLDFRRSWGSSRFGSYDLFSSTKIIHGTCPVQIIIKLEAILSWALDASRTLPIMCLCSQAAKISIAASVSTGRRAEIRREHCVILTVRIPGLCCFLRRIDS